MRTRRIALFITLPHVCFGSERIERRLFGGPLSALTTRGGDVAARIEAKTVGRLTDKSSGLNLKPSKSDEAAEHNSVPLDLRTGAFVNAEKYGSGTGVRDSTGDLLAGVNLLPYEGSAPCERCLKKEKESTGKGDESGGVGDDGSPAANGEDDSEGDNEEIECARASTCEDCVAVPLEDDGTMCWWNGTLCQEDTFDSGHDVGTMCLAGGDQSEAPTPAKHGGDVADEPRADENTTPSMAPVVASKSDGSSTTSSPTSKAVQLETPAPTPIVQTPSAPTPIATTPAPVAKTETKAPTSPPARPHSEDEGVDDDRTFGGTTAMLIGVILLVGVVVCLRRRAAPVGAMRSSGGGGGFGSLPSQPSYQGVATTDDDEEWGWGDEEAPADVELASKKVELEPSPPARKGMSLKGGGIGGLPKKSPPPVSKSRMSSATIRQGRSERQSISSPDHNFHAADASFPPPPPPASPPSRGVHPSAYRPALSPPPLASGPPGHPPPPPAPPAASAKRSDDIFAELGLSANPTFSKPAAPAAYSSSTSRPPPAPSSGGSSPWQQNVAITAPSSTSAAGGGSASAASRKPAGVVAGAATGAAPAATSASAGSSALYRQPVSMDDIATSASDPQWDDDADLDDLLDD